MPEINRLPGNFLCRFDSCSIGSGMASKLSIRKFLMYNFFVLTDQHAYKIVEFSEEAVLLHGAAIELSGILVIAVLHIYGFVECKAEVVVLVNEEINGVVYGVDEICGDVLAGKLNTDIAHQHLF